MYQINDLPIFKLKTSVWDYSHELVDTGVTVIDSKLEDVNIDLLQNQITLEVGTTSSGSLLAEQTDGNVEALLTEAGELIVDEVDGDNIVLEDDPNLIDYIVLEDGNTTSTSQDVAGADNISFDDEAGLNDTDANNDIFDFTEKNPFGDPSDT